MVVELVTARRLSKVRNAEPVWRLRGSCVRGPRRHRANIQWGRRANTAESWPPRGPPSRRPRFNGAAVRTRRRDDHQTGPHAHVHASMGPPCEHGGEVRYSKGDRPTKGGLQWGRRANTAERTVPQWPHRQICTLQWGRRANTAESTESRPRAVRSVVCFNGAAVRTRRRAWGNNAKRERELASMGPPCEHGGETLSGHLQPGRSRSFNGAAVRTRRRALAIATDRPLQLSFNGAAVRTRRRAGARRSGRRTALVASMGPPCEHGGEPGMPPRPLRLRCASMGPPCEHGGESRKSAPRPSPRSLQWGRRANTAESAALRSSEVGVGVASMGPPCEHGGEPRGPALLE